jgi:hypothetical protein
MTIRKIYLTCMMLEYGLHSLIDWFDNFVHSFFFCHKNYYYISNLYFINLLIDNYIKTICES